jgi:hypothetical protein
MDREVEAIKEELFRTAWFMRGGISIEELYQMDKTELNIISKVIKSNLETAKESGMPFF